MVSNIPKLRKRILLTGASGTVGFEALKHLVQNPDYEITVFDLKTEKSFKKLAPFQDRVTLVFGDINSIAALEAVSRNKDVAIHLAAIIPPLADANPGLAYHVNVEGTKNLIDALERYSPQCFLLFSSSVSVYGDRVCNPYISVTDDLKPSAGDQYGETKVLCEEAIQASNLTWSIFRLAAIMGNHKLSKLMFHMPLNTQMEICTPQDTGRAFANAISFQKQLEHRIFNLGGGKECVVPYRFFLDKMFETYGLGEANFPEKAFAEKNFHCGIMADGAQLEEIIHFRRQDLADYFDIVKQQVKSSQKNMAFLFRRIIKRWLLSQSEPYRAFRKNNHAAMKHFFKTNEHKVHHQSTNKNP